MLTLIVLLTALFTLSMTTNTAFGSSHKRVDYMVRGKVVNVWHVKGAKTVLVEVPNSQKPNESTFLEFDRDYFGTVTDPWIGTCVRVWVTKIDNFELLHSNRDLAPCTN